MSLYQLEDRIPRIDPTAWVAPSAVLIGRVECAEASSVWWNAVLRGDNEPIVIGARTNVQDGCVFHTDPGAPLILESDVTIGHKVMLHGCRIGQGSLIGIGTTILNHAVIGAHSLVGAGTLIPERKVYPPRSLIMGTPGKVVRELTDEEVAKLMNSAARYVQNAARYRDHLQRID
jgi:carbonic anhydrase/acetyltransferase-like protein (isoleucine patch superfamily)